MPNWKSRIIRHGNESPDKLLPNPRNWRLHPRQQQEVLTSVLERVGFVQDVVVNERTGHLVDGHLRVALAQQRKLPTIPVVYVDLAQEEEDLVLATLDPINALAARDDEQLRELLESVDADGTLADFLEGLTGAGAAWVTTVDELTPPAAVTQEQIDQRAEELASKFEDRAAEEKEGYVDIRCPDCGAGFSVRRKDLQRPELHRDA